MKSRLSLTGLCICRRVGQNARHSTGCRYLPGRLLSRALLLCLGLCMVPCTMLSCRKKLADIIPEEVVPEAQLAAAPEAPAPEPEAAPEPRPEPARAAVTAAAPLPPAQEPDTGTEEAPAAPRPAENPDYKGGNGTILSYVESDWVRKIIRKCEMEVTVGSMLEDGKRIVYGSMEKENPVATLQDGDELSILQQCTLEYLTEPKDESGSDRGDLWYKIRLADGTDGWINAGDEYLYSTTPYYGNAYEVLGTISSGGRNWTVRKMDQTLSVQEPLSIRDKPGSGSVLYTIRPGSTDPARTDVDVTAVTEEEDTQDGRTDRWVKVRYKDYEGWLFGGYLSSERGGPKYGVPGDRIAFDMGRAP